MDAKMKLLITLIQREDNHHLTLIYGINLMKGSIHYHVKINKCLTVTTNDIVYTIC